MLEPLAHLGPEPFRFTPSRPEISVRAYSPAFRVLATLIVGGCAVWLYLLWREGSLGQGGRSTGLGWFTAGLMLMLYTWWHFMTSRTRLDSQALYQSWVWDKKMELGDLAFCKLIRVRGLDWLIAPRLYARTLMGKFAVFYAADAHMIAEFERLVRELREFRQL